MKFLTLSCPLLFSCFRLSYDSLFLWNFPLYWIFRKSMVSQEPSQKWSLLLAPRLQATEGVQLHFTGRETTFTHTGSCRRTFLRIINKIDYRKEFFISCIVHISPSFIIEVHRSRKQAFKHLNVILRAAKNRGYFQCLYFMCKFGCTVSSVVQFSSHLCRKIKYLQLRFL